MQAVLNCYLIKQFASANKFIQITIQLDMNDNFIYKSRICIRTINSAREKK